MSASETYALEKNATVIYGCFASNDSYGIKVNDVSIPGTIVHGRYDSHNDWGCKVMKFEGDFHVGDIVKGGGYSYGYPSYFIY